MFFTQALKKEAAIILEDTPEIIVQKVVAGRHDLIPLDYAQKIKADPGGWGRQGSSLGLLF